MGVIETYLRMLHFSLGFLAFNQGVISRCRVETVGSHICFVITTVVWKIVIVVAMVIKDNTPTYLLA